MTPHEHRHDYRRTACPGGSACRHRRREGRARGQRAGEIAASRAVVDRALSRNDAVYGLTTQVGHGKDTRLTEEQIREDLLAIELMLARDLLRVRPTKSVLGAGPDAALRMVEEAITVAEPQPDAVHRTLRKRFPVMQAGGSATNAQSVER